MLYICSELKNYIMEIIIKLKKIELTGKAVLWDDKDLGYKNFAGSVYFDNLNYGGLLTHNGEVILRRNQRPFGTHKPTNFIYA